MAYNISTAQSKNPKNCDEDNYEFSTLLIMSKKGKSSKKYMLQRKPVQRFESWKLHVQNVKDNYQMVNSGSAVSGLSVSYRRVSQCRTEGFALQFVRFPLGSHSECHRI